MPTTTGWSGNGSHSVCTRIRWPSKSISGFGTKWFFDTGAKIRRCIISTTLSKAQQNAAASMCPTLLLTPATRSGASRSPPPIALPSMRSPTTVPVAWAST